MIRDVFHQFFSFTAVMRGQWKSPRVIQSIQERKFIRLVRHAARSVPFYRQRFLRAGIRVSDIRSLQDLARLPFTDKSDMQAAPGEELVGTGFDPDVCPRYITSGTTGTPLTIFFSPADETRINMTWIRAFLSAGLRPWHKLAAFIGKEKSLRQPAWYEQFGLFRRQEVSNWLTPDHWIEPLAKFGPDAIIGDIISLRLLGETIKQKSITGITPRRIFNTSILLDNHSRQYLRDTFGSEVFDLYGAFEGGCLAWECSACEGYHLSADTAIVEVLHEGKPVVPGEQGEVVLTNLHSYAMPFIRYRLGDRVTLSERQPVCGRHLPLLENILGRQDDFIRLPGGKKIACQPFYHILNPVPGVHRWRVIQEKAGEVTIFIITKSSFDPTRIAEIKQKITALVERQLEVIVKEVDSIPHDPRLKFRSVITRVGGIFK